MSPKEVSQYFSTACSVKEDHCKRLDDTVKEFLSDWKKENGSVAGQKW